MIATKDGSYTLYSEEYKEAMHSNSGAYEEALYKHVYPSKIMECQHERIMVLDIGFGIGYNALASIIEFSRRESHQNLHIISLERDSSCYSLMKDIHFGDDRDVIYDEIKTAFLSKRELLSERYSLMIILGDARNSIKCIRGVAFDAIFHDPYSPSKNSELWSVEFFKEIYRVTNNSGILTTYSSAPQIRMALIKAGFRIGRGPSVGGKREGTLASIDGNIPYLTDNDIKELRIDIRSTPYRDYLLSDSRENILKRRIKDIRMKRVKGSLQAH